MKDNLTLDILKQHLSDIPNVYFGTQYVPKSEDILFANVPVNGTAIGKMLRLLVKYPAATILSSNEGITLYFTEGTEPFDMLSIMAWGFSRAGIDFLHAYKTGIEEGRVSTEPFEYCFSKDAKEYLARRYVLKTADQQICTSIGFVDPDKHLASFAPRTSDEVYCEVQYSGIRLLENELTVKNCDNPTINLVRFLNVLIEYWYSASVESDDYIRQINSNIKLKDNTQ